MRLASLLYLVSVLSLTSACGQDPGRPNYFGIGEPCRSDGQCGSQHCVDGVCCGTACNGSCEVCNQFGYAGTCRPAAAGTACDDGDSCTGSDHCDGQGTCAGCTCGDHCANTQWNVSCPYGPSGTQVDRCVAIDPPNHPYCELVTDCWE